MVSLIEEGGGGEGELEEEGLEFEITGFVPVDPNRSELEKNKKKREEERKKEGPEYWSEERKKNNRSPTIIVVVSKEEKEEGERMKKRVGGGFGEKFREFCESDKLLDATILSSKDEMDAFLTHFYPLCVDCSAMLTSVVGFDFFFFLFFCFLCFLCFFFCLVCLVILNALFFVHCIVLLNNEVLMFFFSFFFSFFSSSRKT